MVHLVVIICQDIKGLVFSFKVGFLWSFVIIKYQAFQEKLFFSFDNFKIFEKISIPKQSSEKQ